MHISIRTMYSVSEEFIGYRAFIKLHYDDDQELDAIFKYKPKRIFEALEISLNDLLKGYGKDFIYIEDAYEYTQKAIGLFEGYAAEVKRLSELDLNRGHERIIRIDI